MAAERRRHKPDAQAAPKAHKRTAAHNRTVLVVGVMTGPLNRPIRDHARATWVGAAARQATAAAGTTASGDSNCESQRRTTEGAPAQPEGRSVGWGSRQ